jgi:phosphate-selective porin OprO/OprP
LKLKTSALLIAGTLMGAATLPAQANNDSMMDLLQVLRDKGTISAEDYQLLSNTAAADKEAAEADKAEIIEKVESKPSSIVTLDKKGLNFESADKAFTANIGGRIHADYGIVDDNFFGPDATGEGDEFGNGAFFRRARIGMEGTMFTDWFYGLEINYNGADASDNLSFTDAVIGYQGFDSTKITLGRHKMPAGLEELTSSNRISTMERSGATNTFALGRYNGLSVATTGLNWTATGGMWMGDGEGDKDNEDKDSDWGYAARFTFAPIQEKTSVVHLGASYSHLEYEDDFSDGGIGDQRLRQRAGNRFVDDRPVSVTYADTEEANTFGLEAAVIQGPFSLQGEYFQRSLGRKDYKDADVDGWYALATYTLTGESRGYKEGKMRTISPKNALGKGGFGAFELVARYDELDLFDSSAYADNGGLTTDLGTKSEIWTLGLNWYVNDNIRFMANYVDADIKSDAGNNAEGDIEVFMFRGQVAF